MPIVSKPASPKIADPCLLIAWLAIQDHTLERDLKLEDLATITFPPGVTKITLRMRKDALHQPVFRGFAQGAELTFSACATGWKLSEAQTRMASFREPAGFPNIVEASRQLLIVALLLC